MHALLSPSNAIATAAPLVPCTFAAAFFDCVVVDPPWENASARRAGTYGTLPSQYLLSVPMKQLLSQVTPAKYLVTELCYAMSKQRHHYVNLACKFATH